MSRLILRFSIAANLVLLFMLARSFRAKTDALPSPLEHPQAMEDQVVPMKSDAVGTLDRAKSFRWSQIESANYFSYISNLHGIGCPKQTIHDIVAADVHSLYAHRHDLLRGQEVALGRTLESERQKLVNEEQSVVARLLGIPSVLEPSVANASSSDQRQIYDPELEEPQTEVSMPLVLVPVDESVLKLSAEQISLLDTLRDRFVAEIGGLNQDPKDPEYLERWQKAQSRIDQTFKTMFGIQAFDLYQRQIKLQASSQ